MRPKLAAWMILPFLLLLALPAGADVVKEIHIRNTGPGLSDEQAVRAYISLKPGDEFDAGAINRDVKALQKSSRFAKVSVESEYIPGGVSVTYVVETRLRISRLEIIGADWLGNKKVRNLLELGVGDSVDDALLAVHAQKVTDKYQKDYFPYSKLTWTIEPAKEPGTADVRITVKEGDRANVKRILFTGNENVNARALKKVMKQRTVNWLSFITRAGQYDPDVLGSDVQSLRKVYLDKGYLDVMVKDPQIRMVSRDKIEISIPIEEGKQYRLGRISLDGVTQFPKDEVAASIKIKAGQVASMADVQKSSDGIRDYFGSRGRIRTIVKTDMDIDATNRTADVRYRVTEGKLAYIRNIIIRGNTRTKDKVIRRELAVYPGEIFNEVKVRTSEQRLRNLGFFSYVNSMEESTAVPDQYDLVFDVEEQNTGQFSVGAGFSSEDSVLGYIQLQQGNFDLFGWPRFTGGGQKVTARAQLGTKRKDYTLSFVEPWFLNRRLSLGIDLFKHDSSYLSSEYDQSDVGGSVTLGKALDSYNRLNLTYGLEEIDIYNVSSNASETIQEEEGKRTKSYVTLQLVHDSRNNPFIPTEGNRSSIAATLAGGPFGGETDLYEFRGRSSQYFPLWFDHVLNFRGEAGVVEEYGDSDRVPIFDRFFLGGPRTIRGFKFREVGPKDDTGEPIGGKSEAYGTAEYTIPVAEKVRFATFYDVGMVWPDAYQFDFNNLNSSFGVGVRFDFPMFPIQLDYSWPLRTDEWNDRPGGRFSFWLGYGF